MASIAALWGRCSSGESSPGQHIRVNANSLFVGVILKNESDFVDAILKNETGLYVGMILENENDSCVGGTLGNGLGVDASQIDQIPLHNGPPHYHPSFLGYFGPFSSAYLSPPTSNLSPIYVIAPPLCLSPQTVRAQWRLIPFGVSDMTPLRDQIVPLVARAPCLCVFFAFVPTMWIPKKTRRIHFRRVLPNILQKFFLCVSPY